MITNQQATANHTAKMFNQSKVGAIPNNYSLMREKEIKMTRKEAIKKFSDVYRGPYADQFVAGLEALGLIKFDEEKFVVDEAKKYVRNYTLYDRQELAGVIDMLIRHIEK